MKIYSVYDAEFSAYGRVVSGYPVQGLMTALAATRRPLKEIYVVREESLHAAKDAEACGDPFFCGLPYQWGYCCGAPARVEALRFHSGPQLSAGTGDFLLLLARRQEIENGRVDAEKAKAFRVPAGVLVELYGDSLRCLPRACRPQEELRVLMALPFATNTHFEQNAVYDAQDAMICARNAWQAVLSEPVLLTENV